MPRFYFDAHNGADVRDAQGRDLADAAAARRAAVQLAASFASCPDRLIDEGAIVISVRDEADVVVSTVRLACLVDAA